MHEHNLCITYTCLDMYHISYMHTLWLTIKYTHCVSEVFFQLVLVFDFEYSKLTELPMTMVSTVHVCVCVCVCLCVYVCVRACMCVCS